jgi:hypothetical protein
MLKTNILLTIITTASALLAGVGPATASPDAAGEPVWELRPYRVQVLLGVAAGPELTEAWTTALAGRLAQRIPALQGGAWDVTAATAPAGLRQAMVASVAAVTADSLPKEMLNADKVMLLRVATTGGGYEVAAREFDVATGLWSAMVTRPVPQLRKLPDQVLAAIFEAFAPLARVSAVKDRQVLLRLRASAFAPRDPALVPVKAGSVFRLVAKAIAQDGPRQPATIIPWTFCAVQELTPEELRGRLETGLRDPLGDHWESSMDVLALGVVPPRGATLLTLKSTAEPMQALADYEVYASPSAAEKPVLLGRTDRQGTIRVPPADNPLRILLVKHGDQWLARLPLVPGLEPQVSLAVAHDEYRIERESVLSAVRDAVIDLAARRETLVIQLKARIAAKRFEEAETLLAELRRLPASQQLVATRAAELKKNLAGPAASAAKIDAAVANLQSALATSQFDAKAIDELAAEVDKHKEKAKQPAGPAEKQPATPAAKKGPVTKR